MRRPLTRLDIERELCRRSLAFFVQQAWHVIEPAQPYVPGMPVYAIAQHLEAVTDRRITRLLINVPPGPMRHDSLVETQRGQIYLRDVRVGDEVLTHRGRYRGVSAVHEQGVLPILRITTHSGRITHAAPSHPYLTPRGWVDAADLRVGDNLGAVCPEQHRVGSSGLGAEEARLLGYLVGDGSVTQASTVFTNADRSVIDDFVACAAAVGFETSVRKRKTHWSVGVLGGQIVQLWLSWHGLKGCSSYTKRIPDAVRTGSTEAMRNFIGAYWTCDGGFDVRATKTRGSRFRAYGTTVSEQLADDLVQVLGVLGIESRRRDKARKLETAAQPGGVYRSHSVEIQREHMVALFAGMPGLSEAKDALARQCKAAFPQVLWDDPVVSIEADEPARCLCLTVEEDHSFTCSGIAVKNTMKSLLANVFWPAWEWGPRGLAAHRFVGASHEQGLALRDARKMRELIASEWFQRRWPLQLTRDQNQKRYFQNEHTGFRMATAVKSMTGHRGHAVVWDDPLSSFGAQSEAERIEAATVFRETLPTRLVDPETSAIVVIMQRLHEDDPSGLILAEPDRLGYEHLCLPMRYEPDRHCTTSIGFSDPRTVEGELLFPERFPEQVVTDLENVLGVYGTAGQLQQRPTPRTGGFFEWEKLEIIPAETVPYLVSRVRYWDKAGTQGGGKRTAGVLMGRCREGEFYILDVVTGQWNASNREAVIEQTARADGNRVTVWIEQEPGSGGKESAENTVARLAGLTCKTERPVGDKEFRAEPYAVQIAAGRVKVVQGEWNKLYIDEHKTFPRGKFKDQIDAGAAALSKLSQRAVGGMV